MVMNVPLRGKEKEEFKKLIKEQRPNKLSDPKEKIKESSGRTLPIRGQGL